MNREKELKNTAKKYADGNLFKMQKQSPFHKNLPKKVTSLNQDYGYFECSTCDHVINYGEDYTEHNYCLNCGQRLDWTEVVK